MQSQSGKQDVVWPWIEHAFKCWISTGKWKNCKLQCFYPLLQFLATFKGPTSTKNTLQCFFFAIFFLIIKKDKRARQLLLLSLFGIYFSHNWLAICELMIRTPLLASQCVFLLFFLFVCFVVDVPLVIHIYLFFLFDTCFVKWEDICDYDMIDPKIIHHHCDMFLL